MQQTFKDEAVRMQIDFHEDDNEDFFFAGNDFSFLFPITNPEIILGEHLNNSMDKFQRLQSDVVKILEDRVRPDLITTLFEFPAELKVACKQYLVYFAQFLADMGINATTSIEEKANKVLFTVIPEDGEAALANIKEALKIYMDAPEAENFREVRAIANKDIATIQWEANIHHLQGQIALSQAVLQAKDETISALKLTVYQLNQMVSSSKPLPLEEQGKTEEPIFKGIVSVKKYEGKGFSINFPEILRRLKRRF